MAEYNPYGSGSVDPDESIEVRIDGVALRPLVYETESSGSAELSTLTDQCGHVETDQISPGAAQHTIQALLNQQVVRELWFKYGQGDTVEVDMPILDVIDEVEQVMTDFTINQRSELVSIVDEVGNEQYIFDVQIQLKSPEEAGNQ